MLLKDIKDALIQTECGEFLRDGMGFSEPLPIETPEGTLDNCFLYMYDTATNVYSAPVARIGLFAEKKEMAYFISCYEEPFSVKPEETIEAKMTKAERVNKYSRYEELYNSARPLFYKENCNSDEKNLLLKFANAFEDFVDESQRIFYREMVPPFFAWLSEQVSELLEENDG